MILVRSCWIHVMKGVGVFWGSVGACEIYCDYHIEFQSSSKIIYKGRSLIESEGLKNDCSWFFYFRIVESEGSIVGELLRSDGDFSYELIFSIFFPVPHFHSAYLMDYLKLCFLGFSSLEA